MTRRRPTAYLPYATDEPPGTRLFCFHHAGGTASAFSAWQHELGPKVAVLPVQLPGRERRAAEPRFTDMTALIADLDRSLDPLLDRPYAFYGHSMGAIVAYNLTRLRAARGQSLPIRLMVGAYPHPMWSPRSPTPSGCRTVNSPGGWWTSAACPS